MSRHKIERQNRQDILFMSQGCRNTRSLVYKGWLIRDENLGLVEFKEIFRDGD